MRILNQDNENKVKDSLLNYQGIRLIQHFVKYANKRMNRKTKLTFLELEQRYYKVMNYNALRKARKAHIDLFIKHVNKIETISYEKINSGTSFIIKNLGNRSEMLSKLEFKVIPSREERDSVMSINKHIVNCARYIKEHPNSTLMEKLLFVTKHKKDLIENNNSNYRPYTLEEINLALPLTIAIMQNMRDSIHLDT